MENHDFDLREWCREQVRLSGMPQKDIARISGFTDKTISQMMNHKTGTIESWQRVLNALPHINRYELPDVAPNMLRLCDYWDKMTKGESPTTRTIRTVLRKGLKLS
jgi:hypothetical protein